MPKVELKQAVKDCFKVSLDSCSCTNFNVNCDGPNLRNLFEKVAGDNIRTLIWSRKELSELGLRTKIPTS